MPQSNRIKKAVVRAAGSTFWREYIVTSSNSTVAQKRLSSDVSGGDLIGLKVVLVTDSTGLAGMTNFEIGVSGETFGPNLLVVEAASNLGVSAIRIAPSPSPAADTTNDNGVTVTTAVPFLIQSGDSLQYSGSGSAGTGAGICRVLVQFQRVHDGADIDGDRPVVTVS